MKWDDLNLLKYQDYHPPRPASYAWTRMLQANPALAERFNEHLLRRYWLSDRFRGVGHFTGQVRLRGRMLSIQIHNAGMRQNLMMRREELRDVLNEMMGRPFLRNLIFV